MTVFIFQLLSCLMMTGIIWFVQIVHYPLLAIVEDLDGYERKNIVRTGFIVVPLMVTEAVTAVWLLFLPSIWHTYFWIAAGLLALIWLSTIFIQAPMHCRRRICHLVTSNWIRTLLWSLRSAILLIALSHAG